MTELQELDTAARRQFGKIEDSLSGFEAGIAAEGCPRNFLTSLLPRKCEKQKRKKDQEEKEKERDRVVSTSAIQTEQGGLSGGTAILIPTSLEVLEVQEIVKGRILGVLVSSRIFKFWIYSVYLHPVRLTAGNRC